MYNSDGFLNIDKGRLYLRIIKTSIHILIIVMLIFSCNSSLEPIDINDKHIYYNREGPHWQIYISNINGDSPQNISNNPSDDAYGPLWSPDGRFIAFRYDRENAGGNDIYLYDVNGDRKINITSEFTTAENAYPVLWSPDNKKLIYYYQKIGELPYYCIMNLDGTEKSKLFNSVEHDIIDFCDYGNSILFSLNQNLFKKNLITNSTEFIVSLKDMGVYSTWVDDYNPVSNEVLCHEDSSRWNGGATFMIKKISLDTKRIDTLVIAEPGIKILRPVLSNDYSKVAFIERDYTNDISRIILLEKGKKTKLHELTTKNESYGINKIEFSPRNMYITFTVTVNVPNAWARFYSKIYVLQTLTKVAYVIDEGKDSHWNPINDF